MFESRVEASVAEENHARHWFTDEPLQLTYRNLSDALDYVRLQSAYIAWKHEPPVVIVPIWLYHELKAAELRDQLWYQRMKKWFRYAPRRVYRRFKHKIHFAFYDVLRWTK